MTVDGDRVSKCQSRTGGDLGAPLGSDCCQGGECEPRPSYSQRPWQESPKSKAPASFRSGEPTGEQPVDSGAS